jgi:hypothetical protein
MSPRDITVDSELKQQFDNAVMSCVTDLLSNRLSIMLVVLWQNQQLAKRCPIPRLVVMLRVT